MRKKSPSINYKAMPNPKFVKDFYDASKYELVVTMRVKNIVPRPNCNENRKELKARLKNERINKIIDLDGIRNAEEFREKYGLL